ncbi:MAG: IPT/TIG domain-containing protein [Planctomycetota bacterium]
MTMFRNWIVGMALLCLTTHASAQVQITSFSPAEVSYLGQTEFTILGSNLSSGAGTATVRLGIFAVPTITFESPTEIRGIAPAMNPIGAPQNCLVVVSGLGIDQMTGATIPIGPLSVSLVAPASVAEGPGETVTVTGVGFTENANVRIGGNPVPPANVTFVDARTLSLVVPATVVPGTYDVHVDEVDGGGSGVSATLASALTVSAAGPTVLSFDPGLVSFLGGEPFDVSGLGFTAGTVVTIDGVVVPTTFVSSTLLQGVAPSGAIGNTPTVGVSDGGPPTSTLPNAFTYTGPFEITEVFPEELAPNTWQWFQLWGQGFTPDILVEIGGVTYTPDIYFHEGSIGVPQPGLAPGLYDVTIRDAYADGTPIEFTLPTAILVPDTGPPMVDSIWPRELCVTGGTSIRVVGNNFIPSTQVQVGSHMATNVVVSRDGKTISCVAPAEPYGLLGPTWVTVSDYRGVMSNGFGDQVYIDDCPTLRAPEQFETSIAEGTARFQWFNPRSYDSIDVCDLAGNILAVLPGDARLYETPVTTADPLQRAFIGRTTDGDRSHTHVVTAMIPQCDYPPPIGGAVVRGKLDLTIYGGHAPANPIRCSDTGGVLLPPIESTVKYGQAPSSTGHLTPAWVNSIINPSGGPRPTTLITGFTLDQDADRLEFSALYKKVATDFGVALRGKLVQVHPPMGYMDEFTFPDPILGDPEKKHHVTYYRADRDVSEVGALPCPSSGAFKKIPAGEYRLEIYAVGGNPDTPYYIFADDPRDREILIEGVPCPPYPLVEVRDMTGLRTLPNLSIHIDHVSPSIEYIQVDLSARGTYIDENGDTWSVDDHFCDNVSVAPGGGFGSPYAVCLDPPYNPSPHLEYCWTIRLKEPPVCKMDGQKTTFLVPDYNCYAVDVTVTDKACGTSRTFSDTIVVVPGNQAICPPGTEFHAFMNPSPDPASIFAIANLAHLNPANGVFTGKRPLNMQVLVAPKCWCDNQAPRPAVQLSAPDTTGSEDDVEFRLAIVDVDLGATIEVTDLCPDVIDGPKYLNVRIEDLGEVPWSQHLDTHQFRPVEIQARTNHYAVPGAGPLPSEWQTVATFKMTNHPCALDEPFWEGYYDEENASYHFMTRGTEGQSTPASIPNSEEVNFGIVDAGIPSYGGNESRSGFTSRFMTQGGTWSGESGDGKSSGSLFENDMQGAPAIIEPVEVLSTNFLQVPRYDYCDEIEIFNHTFNEELFNALIYAGAIGPIPVNIWGRVGLGLLIDIDALIRNRIAPFDFVTGDDVFELDLALFTNIQVEIPCEIAADILGGIASVALRLRPEVDIKIHPYLDIDIPSDLFKPGGYDNLLPMLFQQNTLSIYMDAEACLQTLILGEQCLPTITIPLVENKPIIDAGSDLPPTTTSCGSSQSQSAGGAEAGGPIIEISSYELANKPLSVTSPDGQVVINGWMSANSAGRFLSLDVTENGIETTFDTGLPGAAWYYLDPDAAFVANDVAIIVGTSPPASYTPQTPPSDIQDPNFLTLRNVNVAHTEVQMAVLSKDMQGHWQLDLNQTTAISDVAGTPSANRFADGRPAIAGDPNSGEALVAWVRYDSDYLLIDGTADFYEKTPGCPPDELCLVTKPNVRPRMEATTITVRKIDDSGLIPGEGMTTIATTGINVQPAIAFSPSGDTAYCVWVHDPTHTDLIACNRGRYLKYAVYDAALDTWSAPSDAVAIPDNYPGLLEPSITLKGNHDGMLSFTALSDDAPIEDTGLGGGTRFVFAARLTNGSFATPVKIRGKCFAREYGYAQSVLLNVGVISDPLSGFNFRPPEWVMTWQEFGHVGAQEGSGNVQYSGLVTGSNEWTAPISLLNPGTVVSNVAATIAGGTVHAVHHSMGLSNDNVSTVGPMPVGYQVTEHAMHPDAAVVDCELSMAFAAPGASVDGKVVVANDGLVSTPFDGSNNSAIGLQIVFVRDDGSEHVAVSQPLPIIDIGEEVEVDFTVEMPHRPVRLVARVFPNPVDRNPANDERECFFGAPAPTDLICELVPQVDTVGVTTNVPRLRWKNPVVYDAIWVYRDGTMIHALPGHAKLYADIGAGSGIHTWEVRGIVAASKSSKSSVSCDVPQPVAPPAFIRGDANADGGVNVADAVKILTFLFSGGSVDCELAMDANDDETANIADPVYVLSALFSGGSPPAAPYPECGVDATLGTLGCSQFVPCE